MTDRSHSRVALDLDALETGIAGGDGFAASGHAPQTSRSGGGASEDARLTELARIVGQNDRFRELLRTPADGGQQRQYAQDPGSQWETQGGAPQDAAFQEGAAHMHAYVSGHGHSGLGHSGHDHSGAGHSGAGDDGRQAGAGQTWDPNAQASGSWEQAEGSQYGGAQEWSGHAAPPATHELHAGSAGWDGAQQSAQYGAGRRDFAPALDPLEALEGARLRSRRPSRGPLYAAVAVVALCVTASAGYFGLRGGSGDGGEAPMIRADASAVKIKPPVENTADPATTREIYEQIAKTPGETRVVANNEQPVDVEQTLRQQRAAAVAAGRLPSEAGEENVTFGAPGVAPLPTHAANRDPRSGLGEPRRVRTVAIGPDGKVRETRQAASTPPAAREVARVMPAATPAAKPAPKPAQQVAKQEHRVPSTMVDETPTGSVGTAQAAPAPRVSPAATASVARGGFAVQLGAPGSEKEAKTLAASLKRKYAPLSGHGTAVVKAQSNGRTIYRLRVPGLSREAATNLCQQLKAAGGNCFVAQG